MNTNLLKLSAFFCFIMLMTSCHKIVNESGLNPNSQKISLDYEFDAWPVNNNEMLVFDDTTHYINYLNFINEILEENDTLELHERLQQIESFLNFISIRNINYSNYENEESEGYNSIEELLRDKTYAPTDIASTLNSNYDVKIGNNILHFVNENIQILVDADQTGLLNEFHTLEQNSTFEDAAFIDHNRHFSSIFDFENGHESIKGSIEEALFTFDEGPLDASFKIFGPAILDVCSNPLSKTFSYLTLHEIGGLSYKRATYEINFGDGTPTEYHTSPILAKNYYVPSFTHAFPAPGTYTVNIKATPNGYVDYVKTSFKVKVPGYLPCKTTKDNKDSGWKNKQLPDNKWLFGRVQLKQFAGSQIARSHSRIITETQLVKMKSNGKFTRYKNNKSQNSMLKYKDNSCTTIGTIAGSSSGKSKTISMHRTAYGSGGVLTWEKLESQHHGDDNTLDIVIYSCD